MYCPNCKKEIADGLQFCPECGAQLGANAAVKKQKKPITKKWWFWVIIVVAVIAIISAVGGGNDKPEKNDTPVVNTTAGNTSSAANNSVQEPEMQTEAQETVLYDKNDIKITYVESSSDFLTNNFKFLIVNNSGKNITVSVENLSVNGFSVDSWFYAQVASGKKANELLEIFSSSLDNNNIDKIENMEFSFHIINSDNYNTIDDSDAVTLTF